MKKTFKSTLIAITLLVAALMVFVAVSPAPAEKRKAGDLVTSSDLDHAFVQSATVKYQLTDEEIEGTPVYYSNGTVVRRVSATIIFDYTAVDARRDGEGRRIWRLRVDRPDFYGGPFEKDAPSDPGRSPGTFDTIQPGDLVH